MGNLSVKNKILGEMRKSAENNFHNLFVPLQAAQWRHK